jgi:hypothetical protein
MTNTNNIVRVKNTHSRSGMVSLLILAAITSVSGVAMAVPTVAYAQGVSTVQDCLTAGGNGGGGGIGGNSGDSNGGVSGNGGGGGSGGNGGTGTTPTPPTPIGSSGGSGGSGGDTGSGGNGGDTLAGNGGRGADGGQSRMTCVLVAPVLSIEPTISVPPESFEPRP